MKSAPFACLAVLALGCAAAPTPPPPPRLGATSSAAIAALDAGEPGPPSAVSVEVSLSAAWDAWQAGDRPGALREFRKDVAALESLPRALNPHRAQWKREAGVAATSVTGQDGDAWRAISTDQALFFVDGHGALTGFVPGAATEPLRFVPGTSLVIAETRAITIFDASTAKRVFTANALGSASISPSGRLVAFMTDAADAEPVALHVWSAATRTERRFPLAKAEQASFEPVQFAPDESAVVTPVQRDSADVFAIFELASGKRVDLKRLLTGSAPAFSPDGKLLATALPFVGDHGFAGTTQLFDRVTGHRTAVSGACSYPNSTLFSKSGKLLLVGDLRRACVFEVPSLRLLAKSAEIRPHAGFDDDLQDVHFLRIVSNDVGFVAGTADGSMGLFRLPSAALLWKGRGDLVEGKDRRHYIYDASGGTRELFGFDDRLAFSSRIVSEAEAESGTLAEIGPLTPGAGVDPTARTLEATLCSVGPWVFPKEACVP